ncbi:PRC-barrel domain-containing protein [Methanocaldococcus indicus]|uniref:PRC-barrel domain-containing protein n=1 Tax=Methanocaldococcus indicus TaxID=213231 RepID=UPI003C6D068A
MAIRVSDIIGKEVYTTKALYVGKVYDVMVDLDKGAISGLVLTNISRGCLANLVSDPTKKVVIPYSLVSAIGNIILIKSPSEANYNFLK